MSKAKYTKGLGFYSLESAIVWMNNGGAVYYRHKFMSSKFIMNWSVVQIKIGVEFGHIVRAIKLGEQ